MKRVILSVFLFGSASLWSAPALALLNFISCSAEANGVNFGNYQPLSGQPVDSTGSVTFECRSLIALLTTRRVSFKVYLDAGTNGSVAQRVMKSGNHTLNYNLYTNPTHNTVWDDIGGTGFRGDTFEFRALVSIGTTRAATYTIYGQIPGGQNVAAGTYSDSITVTVLY